jgi:hypothetical protein
LSGEDRRRGGRISIDGKVMRYAAIHVIEVNCHRGTSLNCNRTHVEG